MPQIHRKLAPKKNISAPTIPMIINLIKWMKLESYISWSSGMWLFMFNPYSTWLINSPIPELNVYIIKPPAARLFALIERQLITDWNTHISTKNASIMPRVVSTHSFSAMEGSDLTSVSCTDLIRMNSKKVRINAIECVATCFQTVLGNI